MGKRIISLQEAQSITNDDYLVIDNQSSGTKKVSAGFINDIVSDVEVDGTSVVNNGVAEIDLSGKQDTIVAGSNITIAADGKTISATDTTYTAGTNVDITNGVISATDTTYTAGTNVQINNGVISATDTTYSAFNGATAGADGSSGLVPQPLIADKDKFLKGDGTWDTIQPGASVLDDLTNVDITSPTNGQVLKYDSTNQEWVNANESGGGGGSTVTITPTLATGTKIADYSIDGTAGALYAPSGGGASAVADLTDVNLTSLANGQILKYDSTTSKWVNANESGGGGAGADEMTLDEYNALTISQKNDGTIRFIPASSIGSSSAINMSSIHAYIEDNSNCSDTSTTDETVIACLMGTGIGNSFYYTNAIDVTDWDKITFDVVTGTCYPTTSSHPAWFLQIGLMQNAPSQTVNVTTDSSAWAVVKGYSDQDASSSFTDQELDVSNLTGNYYLVVSAHGWNATISDFTLTSGEGYPSQIKYMSKTYALEGDMHTYSTTEHQVGTWIDGSDLYERTINITAENFTATQDMDISNYIDSTEVIHESIGVFNYIYQGVNYATPINGRETEILYWDGAYKLRLNFGSGSLDSMDAYITIRYTKVTS